MNVSEERGRPRASRFGLGCRLVMETRAKLHSSRTRALARLGGLALFGALSSAACLSPLPPYPSVTVVVDTDLPVPRAVERLRVDVFDEDGTWIDSRDYPRASREDFPATFTVFTKDESRPRDVTVRLRAYPEGAVRDYRGHRAAPQPTFAPVRVSESLAELCANATELVRGTARTFRRGALPLTETSDRCPLETRTGSVAATVTIPTAGRYRFEVVGQTPGAPFGGVETTLFLRRSCLEPSTEIDCNDDIADGNYLSRLILDLRPGTYTLMVGGALRNQPADVTLQWDEERLFVPIRQAAAPPYVEPGTDGPRLVVDGRDVTPREEPTPSGTVDRLVQVHLEPSVAARVRFTLHGACAAVEPTLVFDEKGRLVVSKSLSCATSGALTPITTEAAPEAPDAKAIGSGATEEPCPPNASDDAVVCVPGGAFVLGDRALDSVSASVPLSGYPLRLVTLSRFYMDRREVTVGRYRDARAKGLAVDAYTDAVDIATNKTSSFNESSRNTAATWSPRDLGRESYPLNSVTWAHAREVCRFYGGDLPTEAQWEYVATSAGRAGRTRFPWGNELPTCERVVGGRTKTVLRECEGLGPVSVDELAARGDVNALGIEGLGGNVTEHVRDSAARYDDPCWAGRPAKDPQCDDPTDPYRVARGGSWLVPTGQARSVLRSLVAPGYGTRTTGFRCVYASPPKDRWSGP